MSKFKVVLTEKTWPVPYRKLQEHCEVRLWEGPGPIPRETLVDWLQDADGLFSVGHAVKVDDELLSVAPKLRVVAQAGVGYDNIDVEACTRRGIPFGNTPGVLVEATADLAFGILLTAMRRIHEGWNLVKAGQWREVLGSDLYGKTLGIVGLGDIGSAVARRAQASGMNVIYHNRKPREDDERTGARYVSFDELLTEADCIVVLVPFSAHSRGMFGREQFAKMKQGAYFVNAARGPLVQTDALYDALKTNQIAYAALDVTDPEPLPGDHPLLTLPNILITPHIGSCTSETRERIAMLTVDNLLAGLNKKALPACVNPSVNYSGMR
ncbi:D-glycerate dehydrogenase [Paenibacillus sp. sptzw28]|uniref:2-hydroxyacid dehydrogenase n=1 Tax=Paenibacillus sp. sptzw28 TaxID=715179 RepID=UPI001C6EC972|nr:D-glycerate dehydrogenase [Paenibacillus sp. sptzw28]QYR21792.1 D-glycerate dehydrogenase [Paenibacillus sp. sptzw28]